MSSADKQFGPDQAKQDAGSASDPEKNVRHSIGIPVVVFLKLILKKKRISIRQNSMQWAKNQSTVKLVLSSHSKKKTKIGFQDRFSLNAVQSTCIAECSKGNMLPLEHSAILLIFIELPFVNNIFVLSSFVQTGFTVMQVFI